MCTDPPGKHLKRFAVCTCGAQFPECDFKDFLQHATSEWAVNHQWTLVDPKWLKERAKYEAGQND